MNRLVRTFGVMMVAVVAASNTGCMKSENEGKLENTKWASAYVPEFKGVKGATATVNFTEGGQFTMELRVPQGAIRMSGNWRLGPGTAVYFENVSPPLDGQTSFVEHITITGDVMTMEEANLKIVFTRIDEVMEKAANASTRPSNPAGPGPSSDRSERTPDVTERNGKTVKKNYD